MITMIRPSENARVTNLDDITSIRYSYGNQDGYVINKGQELSHTINGQNFVVNSGRIVLQGVESDIDDNGVSIFIDAISEKRYHLVYYNVNMATDSVSLELLSSASTYPTVDYGDDFNQVSSGIARLPLYKFTSQNGVISNVEKLVSPIDYTGSALVGYDISKGTIEERLSNLGFKEESVSLTPDALSYFENTSEIKCKKQGNFVIVDMNLALKTANLTLAITPFKATKYLTIGNISETFRPKTTQYGVISLALNCTLGTDGVSTINFAKEVQVQTDGDIFIPSGGSTGSSLPSNYSLNSLQGYRTRIIFGYEAS